jgi:diguanylate cyclase (GGDEF)-like protein
MSSGSEVAVAAPATPAALLLLSRDRVRLSESTAAMALATEAEALALATGDRAARAEALAILANCHRLRDEYPEALVYALQAVDLSRELGDPSAEARARSEIVRVLLGSGDTTEALEEGLRALELAEAGSDLNAYAVVLNAVGIVYLSLQQFDLAIELCERAAETARLVGDEIADSANQDTIGCALMGIAGAARAEGDEAGVVRAALAAAERSQVAMLIAGRLGFRRNEATAVANLAESLAVAGAPERALELLESWQIDPARDSAYTITHHLDTRGAISMVMGRYDEAVALFSRALELAESKGAAMMFCEHLADAYERNGDFPAALSAHKRFHRLFAQVASEAAQHHARVAAVRLETKQAKASAEQERLRADALQRLSLEDPLTGLANRRRLDDEIAASDAKLAIAMIDVDQFKRVNDEFSHQVGDEVLRQLAALLAADCRSDDLAARYGGEEFAVLLHGLSSTDAVAAAERIRREVEGFAWEKIAPGLAITVSIGLALGSEAPHPVALLSLADQRLYQAKRTGRNRVVAGG